MQEPPEALSGSAEAMGDSEEGGENPGPRGRGETILIIDDDPMVIDVLHQILERLGYAVVTARGGTEAMRVASEHRGALHLAILDMGMRQPDSAETFEHLRQARPGMPIIICSGSDPGTVPTASLMQRATAFLPKPFTVSVLADVVRHALDAERPERDHPPR